MENRNEKLLEIRRTFISEMPSYKLTEFLVSNAYLTAFEKGYLDVIPAGELYDYAKELNAYYSKKTQTKICEILNKLEKNELKELVRSVLTANFDGYRDFNQNSSEAITDIAYELLNIDDAGHIVYDLGSGNGNVLIKFLLNSLDKGYHLKDIIGHELNVNEAKLSEMALDILNDVHNSHIQVGNALDSNNTVVFTKGYCLPPFGFKYIFKEKTRKSLLFNDVEFTARNTPEWVFVDKLLQGMWCTGNAVAIVSGRALFNDADKEYRERLIESGLLEGIIELPSGALNFTNMKSYMLVFSHANTEIKIVDASEAVDAKTKRLSKIEVSAEKVISLYQDINAPKKRIAELKKCQNLKPSILLINLKKPKNGLSLGELAEVFTGNQYTMGVFEKNGMLTDENTGYRILTSSDIEDGVFDWKSLKSVSLNDSKFEKYALRRNDIVVTSKSSKVKTAVVDIEPKEKIIVTGGMIIIRPNLDKIDPTYLKMFLDSDQGQNALKSIQKGATIITINSKDLSTIVVPLIPLEKQKDKAFRFNEKLTTLYALKQEIKKLEDSIKIFYLDDDEEINDDIF